MYSLTLYHHPLSVCSMKVRLALEEKGLTWSGNIIDIVKNQEQLDPWYVKKNPKGVIPTLEYNKDSAEIITDSASILRFLAAFTVGNQLLPESKNEIQLMEILIDLADRIDLQILSYARHPSMEKSEQILDARINKSLRLAELHPELKDSYQTSANRSIKSKNFRIEKEFIEKEENRVFKALAIVEKQLSGNDFLVGDTYTLADVIWTVVLSRLDLLGYNDWVFGKSFPKVANYYQRVQHRPSFSKAQIQNQWWQN